ncbi:unnamed protein product [Lathyrus oleraceus]
MMEKVGIFEMDNLGDYYTWSNKQTDDPIYSRIDKVLGNLDWLQGNLHTTLTNMDPIVSDNDLLCMQRDRNERIKRSKIKFIIAVADMEGFAGNVAATSREPTDGRPMYILWMKLKRLQPIIKRIIRPLSSIQNQVQQARAKLNTAHQKLIVDRLNNHIIEGVKARAMDVIKLNVIEEQMLQLRAKIDWLRLGDGSNSFFHVSLKSKQK